MKVIFINSCGSKKQFKPEIKMEDFYVGRLTNNYKAVTKKVISDLNLKDYGIYFFSLTLGGLINSKSKYPLKELYNYNPKDKALQDFKKLEPAKQEEFINHNKKILEQYDVCVIASNRDYVSIIKKYLLPKSCKLITFEEYERDLWSNLLYEYKPKKSGPGLRAKTLAMQLIEEGDSRENEMFLRFKATFSNYIKRQIWG